MPYTALANSYGFSVYNTYRFQGHGNYNNNDYSCYIIAVALVYQSYGVHITPMVINNLGADTDIHTNTHIQTSVQK